MSADTRAVRPGEELDAERLGAFLADKGLCPAGTPLEISQFPSGHSNLTYEVRAGAEAWVLRRPPFGTQVATAHDMGRELRVLSHLAPVYPRAPRPVAFCDDPAVLGARFYLMERRRGVILRKEVPASLGLDAPTARRLCESFVDALAELHAIDYAAVGLGELGNPTGYVERQVSGWSKRYRDAATDDIPAVEAAASWLAAHIPQSGAPALIHNDFKFDNMMLDPGDLARITTLLDWEMSTIGDPLMDLGTALCYWVEAGDAQAVRMFAFGPTMREGMMTRRELAERYAAKTGRDLGNIGFYHCFGLFKTAVVAQQIYTRWKQGKTKDERFGAFIHGVRLLADSAVEASQKPLL